jgi:outer membrane protein TolC
LILSSNVVFIAENALKTFMGYTATNWAATTGRIIPTDKLMILPTVLDVNQSWGEGYNRRPDLAQMRQNLERADLNMRFRRNQLFPSLDVIAGYGRRGADAIQYDPLLASDPLIQNDPLFRREASLSTAVEQLDNATAPNDFVGVIFALPLSFTAERANYRAGKKLKEQAELMIKQREELVLREVSDAFNWATTAYDRIQATTRTREYAQAALRAEEQKLARGTSPLFFVLQLQSDVAAAETSEIRARADYNKALSQLHFAEGTLLDRVHMDLEVQ